MSAAFRVIKEGLQVAILVGGAGIIANAFNEEGLLLRRDYFAGLRDSDQTSSTPESDPVADTSGESGSEQGDPEQGAPSEGSVVVATGSSEVPDVGDPTVAIELPGAVGPEAAEPTGSVLDSFEGPSRVTAKRLLDKNIQVITHDEVVALYKDELFEYDAYAFIDARTPAKWSAGHIPRAIVFDHFHFDKYIDEVFNHCQGAMAVIIYCHGGECTDSELAAQLLLDRGIDRSILKVYVGGVEAWEGAGLPLKQESN